MKIFISILLISLNINLVGQNIQSIDCNLLEEALKSEAFQKHFFVCKQELENVIIIDTSKYFDCNLPVISGCRFTIDRTWPNNVSINKKTEIEHVNKIIIYNFKKNKNVYLINFWHPYSNGNLILELKKLKRKTKIKIIDIGVF